MGRPSVMTNAGLVNVESSVGNKAPAMSADGHILQAGDFVAIANPAGYDVSINYGLGSRFSISRVHLEPEQTGEVKRVHRNDALDVRWHQGEACLPASALNRIDHPAAPVFHDCTVRGCAGHWYRD
jgi:hypothetical protein